VRNGFRPALATGGSALPARVRHKSCRTGGATAEIRDMAYLLIEGIRIAGVMHRFADGNRFAGRVHDCGHGRWLMQDAFGDATVVPANLRRGQRAARRFSCISHGEASGPEGRAFSTGGRGTPNCEISRV
jgi:hypothetical protein